MIAIPGLTMSFKSIAAITSLLAGHVSAVLMVNELAVTPQMGWDNWYNYLATFPSFPRL